MDWRNNSIEIYWVKSYCDEEVYLLNEVNNVTEWSSNNLGEWSNNVTEWSNSLVEWSNLGRGLILNRAQNNPTTKTNWKNTPKNT